MAEQCHQMLLSSRTMPSPPRETVCPTTLNQNKSFLPCFMSSVLWWQQEKARLVWLTPRTIRKAPILYLTIFLTIQFWVYSRLPRDFEHINSLHYHTQCCFVKEGCNLIFLFLWVICVLSLKACKRIPLFLWYPLMLLKNVSVWGHLPCSAALGVLSVQNPFSFCDLLRKIL